MIEQLIQSLNSKYNQKNNYIVEFNTKKQKETYMIKVLKENTRGKEESFLITFDPTHKLKISEYKDTYYCSTEEELEELINFFIDNAELYNIPENSEDVLDQSDTCKLSYRLL